METLTKNSLVGPVKVFCDMQLVAYVFVSPPIVNPATSLRLLRLVNFWKNTTSTFKLPLRSNASVYIPLPIHERFIATVSDIINGKQFDGPPVTFLTKYEAPPRPGKLKLIDIRELGPYKPGNLKLLRVEQLDV